MSSPVTGPDVSIDRRLLLASFLIAWTLLVAAVLHFLPVVVFGKPRADSLLPNELSFQLLGDARFEPTGELWIVREPEGLLLMVRNGNGKYDRVRAYWPRWAATQKLELRVYVDAGDEWAAP